MNRMTGMKTLAAVAALAVLGGCNRQKAEVRATPPKAVGVVKAQADTPMKATMRVQGSLRVKDRASVAARVPGTIDGLFGEEGTGVKAGDVLFTVDRENLENAVRVASNELAIARAKTSEVEASLRKATLDRDRLNRLVEKSAVTKDAAERAELQFQIATSGLAAIRATTVKAESALAIATKNLADSRIVAPFDGIIVRKDKNLGDYVSPGKAVFEMENSSVYEVSCSVNADRYAEVKVGETEVAPFGPASLKGKSYKVTYKSAAVNPVSRTFEVRAEVPVSADMVSGMVIDAEIVTRSYRATTLPASALAFLGGEWTVYAVTDSKVSRIAVKRGAEYDGRVEIGNPEAVAGKDIVGEGILLVNEGDTVRVK
jgi:RND family efflux transporter MFP subunit